MVYRSRAQFFGLPLIHLATGQAVDGSYRRGVAVGWIAVGDIAFGVFLAIGGIAVGGIGLGGLSIGLLGFGGAAVGLLALGGLAIGWLAAGGAALAWDTAVGGLAVAKHQAIGGVATAEKILTPGHRGLPSFSDIPHQPMQWQDGALLAMIFGVVLVILLIVRRHAVDPQDRR